MIDGSVILVTGGTGSFGARFTETVLRRHRPKKLIVFSRDEFKQAEMARRLPDRAHPVRYFLWDVRDKDRLYRAFDGVDHVVHAAALKQVPALEYNPFEAVKTNILGAANVADAAIDRGVRRVVALSTDKAVNPTNLYGATKLSMEKILLAANAYAGERAARFSVVRYGNVVRSRGSVIPLFEGLAAAGARELPLTDARMTRFWITLDEAVELVLGALEDGAGGEVIVPKMPSVRITDVARAVCPGCSLRVTGIRPGEKLHETLISEDEARTTVDLGSRYVVKPPFEMEPAALRERYGGLPGVAEGFVYRSDLNDRWIGEEQIRQALRDEPPAG